MWVRTRRMDELVKTLGINPLSRSQLFRLAADLDEHVEQFRHRPLGRRWPVHVRSVCPGAVEALAAHLPGAS